MPFFLIGVYAAVRTGSPPTLLLLGFFAAAVAFHTIVPSQLRYRLAFMPVFFVIATLGIREAAAWYWRNSTDRPNDLSHHRSSGTAFK